MAGRMRIGIGFGMVMALALLAGESQAQYARYGWGGWGGGGTVQGSIARGLGYYNMGAGVYNYDTAVATAINENTVKDWNQFMFLSQQEANRREYLRMARRQQRDATSGDLIYQRLRDNPSERDIRDGDALNVVLDQITDPKVHSSALRLATDPITSAAIREIPFEHASEAAVISLDQLSGKDGWPFALRGANLAEERKAYEDAVDRALKEDEAGDLKPETIQAVRAATDRLHAKFVMAPPQDRIQLAEAVQYFKTLYGMAKMLESPQVAAIIAELEKAPNTSLGSLLGFMHAYNLRFAPATTPKQEAVYRQLYPLLVTQRDKVMKAVGTDEAPATTGKGKPTDFFAGMHLDYLSGRKAPQATPTPK